MAIAFVASVSAKSTDGNGFTTGAIDTTGANFIIVGVSSFDGTTTTLSDSKSNTWTPLTKSSGSGGGTHQFFYCLSATVGSGHTFTVSSGGTFYPSVYVGAFSGVATSSAFDVESSSTDASNGITAASVTPSVDNELLVAGLMYTNGDTVSIDLGFTVTEQQPFAGGQAFGGAQAYLIETTAAAKAPHWSWTSACSAAAVMATFKAAAAAGTTFFAGYYDNVPQRRTEVVGY